MCYAIVVGALYAFKCPNCTYEAQVSGGADVGFNAETITVSCKTCKKLRDVVVGLNPGSEKRTRRAPKCPSSRTRMHVIARWKHPGPCPKCGATMTRDEMPSLLWD